jgi:hypothetical protein
VCKTSYLFLKNKINESQTMLVFDYLAKFFGTLMGVIIGLILNNNSLKNKRYLVNSKPQKFKK